MISDTVEAANVARFHIADWMAYGPGLETREKDVARSVELPPMLRRRISSVGQIAFRASYALGEQRMPRFVFCSRHGEFDRTLRILRSLATEEPISPADFSLSVHNALAGLLSMAWSNTAGHTAMAAGADSFGYGLLESAACLNAASDDRVMLVYFDDALPAPYDEIIEGRDECVALAIVLEAPRRDGHDFSVTFAPRDRNSKPPSATGQARDFIDFMLSGERERTSLGERTQWRWRRCD